MALQSINQVSKRGNPLLWAIEKGRGANLRIAAKIEEETRKPINLFIPGLSEDVGAMPTWLAASGVFAPRPARARQLVEKMDMHASRRVGCIKFSGRLLGETQAEIWMHAILLASRQPLGTLIKTDAATFLRSIEREGGGQEYELVREAMMSMSVSGGVSIETLCKKTGEIKKGQVLVAAWQCRSI